MEKLVFTNGKYFATFNISNPETFLSSFCANNGFETSEVMIRNPLSEEQQNQVQAKVAQGCRLVYVDGKATCRKHNEEGAEVVELEITLSPG